MSGPFGHSYEYVAQDSGFDHENAFSGYQLGGVDTAYQYRRHALELLVAGSQSRLSDVLDSERLACVGELISGQGRLGLLMSGDLDLDNLDNVCRMAHHMGLRFPRELPERLAGAMFIDEGKCLALADASALELVAEWQRLRRRMYELLLLNPEEFSAKCMLGHAVELTMSSSPTLLTWSDTDAEMLDKMGGARASHYGAREDVQRLMVGDLYGCCGIFTAMDVDACAQKMQPASRREIETALQTRIRAWASDYGHGVLKSAMVALHFIVDVNKTDRAVRVRVNGCDQVCGEQSHCVHIGVFLANRGLNMTRTRGIQSLPALAEYVQGQLKQLLGVRVLRMHELYSEGARSSC